MSYPERVSDALFPSGPWVGFYTYTPRDKHRMDLDLTFAGGQLQGHGRDDIGDFVIRGTYDTASRECHWTKTYPGSHDVFYRGFREGKGIWGTWEIGLLARGGFHIWPKGLAESEGQSAVQEEPAPAEAIGREVSVLLSLSPNKRPSTGCRSNLCPGATNTGPVRRDRKRRMVLPLPAGEGGGEGEKPQKSCGTIG